VARRQTVPADTITVDTAEDVAFIPQGPNPASCI
jgi:hypothetical protein